MNALTRIFHKLHSPRLLIVQGFFLSRVYESLHRSFEKTAGQSIFCAIIARIHETCGLNPQSRGQCKTQQRNQRRA